jgi:hypothetical protein
MLISPQPRVSWMHRRTTEPAITRSSQTASGTPPPLLGFLRRRATRELPDCVERIESLHAESRATRGRLLTDENVAA